MEIHFSVPRQSYLHYSPFSKFSLRGKSSPDNSHWGQFHVCFGGESRLTGDCEGWKLAGTEIVRVEDCLGGNYVVTVKSWSSLALRWYFNCPLPHPPNHATQLFCFMYKRALETLWFTWQLITFLANQIPSLQFYYGGKSSHGDNKLEYLPGGADSNFVIYFTSKDAFLVGTFSVVSKTP